MKKIIICASFIFTIMIVLNTTFAGCSNCTALECRRCGTDCAVYDNKCMDVDKAEKYRNSGNAYSWWTDAFNFFSGNSTEEYNDDIVALDDIQNIILVVGNMVFVIVTVVLGVKYIWGGVESKANVKDSLVTLIVAAIFFYGYGTIRNLFVGDSGVNFLKSNFEMSARTIYSTVLYICNFLALGGIIYIGIKYMLAGAEGKANLKAKSVVIVLGIIMVYATITFLNFIVSAFV